MCRTVWTGRDEQCHSGGVPAHQLILAHLNKAVDQTHHAVKLLKLGLDSYDSIKIGISHLGIIFAD